MTHNILYITILVLFFIHEMDAIRKKEWNMFLILKDMDEEKGYQIFTVLHIPIYFMLLYLLINGTDAAIYLGALVDVFFIFHSLIHIIFLKHRNNQFIGFFSNVIIHSLGIIALVHLITSAFILCR